MSFPNFKGKHLHDSMFTPSEFMEYQKKLGKYPKIKVPTGIIFCYQKSLLDYIIKNHKTEKAEGFHGDLYLLGDTNNKIALFGNFGIGSPVAVALFEELIAFGVEKFISIGTAGTLQKHIDIGSIVVCNRAIRDEGTSHHYLKKSKYAYPSKIMTKRIIDGLTEQKQNYSIGTTWTIDAVYRETVEEAKHYQKEGVLTVDMEASALFSVAKYRNVDIGSIFTISDSLAELVWTPHFQSKKTKEGLETLYKIAVNVLMKE